MPAMLRTSATRVVIRQLESVDALRVFSTVESEAGFRFIEEAHIHEPPGPGYDAYWYWEKTAESGIYATEQEAFDAGMATIAWLKNST